jgi:hypothetical protein
MPSANQGRPVGLVPPPSAEYAENLDATDAGEAHRYHHVLDLYNPDLVILGRAERLLHRTSGELATLADAEGGGS